MTGRRAHALHYWNHTRELPAIVASSVSSMSGRRAHALRYELLRRAPVVREWEIDENRSADDGFLGHAAPVAAV